MATSDSHDIVASAPASRTWGRALRCLLMAVLCLAAASALTGCKYSDVLTQHTEDPNAAVDETQDPIYQNNPDAEERDDLDDMSADDSDDVNNQQQMLPHYDPDAGDNGTTLRRLKSDKTPHDEEATEGDDESQDADREGDNEGEGDDSGDSDNSDDTDEDGNGDSDEAGDGDEGADETSDEADDPAESSEGGQGDTVTVDQDGTDDDTAKGTVAAVGEYATIAQMLGGAGALAACDSDWLKARESDGAFDGELDRVKVAFSGDGTKSGSCDVDTLIKKAQPSVVLWDSAANEPALSDSDRAKLEKAGITVQAVPHLGELTTEDSDITAAVSAVAAVLEGASGLEYDPVDTLEQYEQFHDSVLKACYDANDGYSYKVTDSQFAYLYQDNPLSGLSNATTTRVATVYVASLMHPSVSHATVSQTATTSSGTISLAHNGQSLDVSDGVGLSATTNTSGYMLMDYYLQLAGVMNNSYDNAKPDSDGKPYIIMPGSTAAFGTSSRYASRSTASALFYNAGDGTVASNWHVLGNDDFPAMLVSSSEVMGAIVSSASKDDGLYRMESSYDVAVVPTGIAGQWTEGHVDSFLLAPWAFRVKGSENLDAAASYASAFYEKFFRCSNWENAISDWDTSETTAS